MYTSVDRARGSGRYARIKVSTSSTASVHEMHGQKDRKDLDDMHVQGGHVLEEEEEVWPKGRQEDEVWR